MSVQIIESGKYKKASGKLITQGRFQLPNKEWRQLSCTVKKGHDCHKVLQKRANKAVEDYYNKAKDLQVPIDYRTATVETLVDDYMSYVKYINRRTTVKQYGFYVEKYIKPCLGKKVVSELTTRDAETLYEYSNNIKGVKQGLGALKCFIRFINWNVDFEKGLAYNPIRRSVIKMALKVVQNKKREEEVILSISQNDIKSLFDYVKNTVDDLPIQFMAGHGMRIGEALGVDWQDIDFKNNEIHVHQAIDEFAEIVTVKTRNSDRRIPLLSATKSNLLQVPVDKRNGLVWKSERGLPMCVQNYITKHFLPIVRKLKEINPDFSIKNSHMLRKFFISQHIDRGTNIEVVSRMVGHRDSNITAQVYAKPINETRHHNWDLMSELITGTPTPHLLKIDVEQQRDEDGNGVAISV